MATKSVVDIVVSYTPEELERRHAARNKKVLFKQGAYLRTAMQRSMRYSKKPSTPGKPPHAHKDSKKGPLLRKLTRFDVDLVEGSVTCGPPKVGGHSPTVPEVLNNGGRVPIARLLHEREFQVGEMGPIRYAGDGKFIAARITTPAQAARASRLQKEENAVRAGKGSVTIAARPFTAPLLSDGGKKLMELIKNTPL